MDQTADASVAGDDRPPLTAEQAAIRRAVDAAPPLTARQRNRLAYLLRAPGDGVDGAVTSGTVVE